MEQAQYVQGYYRNLDKEEPTKKQDGGTLIAVTMFGMSASLMAIIYIRITLALVALSVAAYYIHRFIEERKLRESLPKLIVNNAGKSTTIYL